MSVLLVELEEQAQTLLPEERAHLVQVLLESLRDPLQSEIEEAWQREIEGRVSAYDQGEMASYPAAEVFAEARRLTR